MELNSLSVPFNILLILFTEYYANITPDKLYQSKKEHRIKDIQESIKYFYLPVKDILEPCCALLKANRDLYDNRSDSNRDDTPLHGTEDYHLIEHGYKMTKLKSAYLDREENANDIQNQKLNIETKNQMSFLYIS